MSEEQGNSIVEALWILQGKADEILVVLREILAQHKKEKP